MVDLREHYSNPSSPGETANQSGVTWPDLINPRVRTAIGELYDHVFGATRDSATIRCGRAPSDKHSIHRTTVLALLERHRVPRRGRVLTSDHVERAVSLYASGRSCASIGKELQVNPETIRQALLKDGVAMRRPGRPRAMES